MTLVQLTRRSFVSDSARTATTGWLALQLPWLAALAGCSRENDRASGAFTVLTPAEARAMRAFAAQIIPSDDGTPGAEDAGAVHFVDRALGMPFFAPRAPVIRAGLADLDVRAQAVEPRSGEFASLSNAQQIAIMKQIEHHAFFAEARTFVVIGTLADPSYGGNRDGVGWTMMGVDHRPTYAPPFGWYDAGSATDSTPSAQ